MLILLQPHLTYSIHLRNVFLSIDVNFITGPSPPTEFACIDTKIFDRSMLLTWKEPATPNGYIQHYIIYIMFRNMQITTNGSVLEQEIDGLTPGKKISVKNNHYLLWLMAVLLSCPMAMWPFVKSWNLSSSIINVSFMHFNLNLLQVISWLNKHFCGSYLWKLYSTISDSIQNINLSCWFLTELFVVDLFFINICFILIIPFNGFLILPILILSFILIVSFLCIKHTTSNTCVHYLVIL